MTTRVNSTTIYAESATGVDNITTNLGGPNSNGTFDVSVGDVIVAAAKWEYTGSNPDPVFTNPTGGSIGTWVGLTRYTHGTVTMGCRLGYCIVTTGGTGVSVNVDRNTGDNMAYVTLHVEVFRPAGGASLALGTGGEAPVGATGTRPTNTIDAGTISASAAGFGFLIGAVDNSGTWTATTNWTGYESSYGFTQFRILSGSASLTGNPTYDNSSVAWAVAMLYFKETGGGGTVPSGGSVIYTGNSSPMNYTMTPRTA